MTERFRIDWNNLPRLWSRPRVPDDREKLIRVRKGPKKPFGKPREILF